MGKRSAYAPTRITAKEQSNVRQFVYNLFEENYSPDEALAVLKSKFDAEDFAKVREIWGKLNSAQSKEARGPRNKN